jgi:SNF2-related domain/Helicase conserved C-terminal domain
MRLWPSKTRIEEPSREVTEAGWQMQDERAQTAAEVAANPVKAYLSQLIEEGYAVTNDEGYLVPWVSVYSLLDDVAHSSSVPLLQLPVVGAWLPILESRGTPSDATFAIAVTQWFNPAAGKQVGAESRTGACLHVGVDWSLLPEAAWLLVDALKAFSLASAALSPEERLREAGRLVACAKACAARLDDYLKRTDIVSVDHLNLELTRSEILGEPVVTVCPTGDGIPDEWIGTFDRYKDVRARYDVVTPDGGMAHVMPSPDVREVLQSIKQLPGRAVASDAARAFLRNPYAMLGDGAATVISPDEFEQARSNAGVHFKTLQADAVDASSAFRVRVVDASGAEPDLIWSFERSSGEELLRRAARSKSRGLPLVSWEGEEVELGGETDRCLDGLKKWCTVQGMELSGVQYAEVFDLSAYSDRVVGFEGEITAVPYVARKSAEQGWIPENIETGVLVSDGSTSKPHRVALTPEQLGALDDDLKQARVQGRQRVKIPGSETEVSVEVAAQWLDAIEAQGVPAVRSARNPPLARSPPPPENRPVLQILHNVEALDYGAKVALTPPPPNAVPAYPQALCANVKPLSHQRTGVAWLQHRFGQQADGIRGCLLADDMGLGKTMQALCLIAWSLEQGNAPKPVLVVAPVSLLENWKTEIAKFLNGMEDKVLSLYGETLKAWRVAPELLDAKLLSIGLKKFLNPDFAKEFSVVLTTYETLRDYEFSLARVSWSVVVCDEAQKIKNPSALVTRAAKALRADFKIACTGTPVENSLADLWCLFDFCQPGLLGSLNEFTRAFRRSIETRSAGHEPLIESLRGAIEPWILRRLKEDVADLQPKEEREEVTLAPGHMRLPMSPLQDRLYGHAVAEFRRAMQEEGGRGAMLSMLHRLRMICSNPASVAFPDPDVLSVEQHLEHSPKLAWLLQQLAVIRDRDEKVLIFTEFREIQRLIQRAIQRRFDLQPAIINGSTSTDGALDASRQRMIDKFQSSPKFNVIILSTTAMGFGVNIQAANHVIHFTRPWNPAKEDQATDRAYRIGQLKSVYVYYPTVVGRSGESFDQRVDALLLEKRALSRDLLAGSQEISVDDFRSL